MEASIHRYSPTLPILTPSAIALYVSAFCVCVIVDEALIHTVATMSTHHRWILQFSPTDTWFMRMQRLSCTCSRGSEVDRCAVSRDIFGTIESGFMWGGWVESEKQQCQTGNHVKRRVSAPWILSRIGSRQRSSASVRQSCVGNKYMNVAAGISEELPTIPSQLYRSQHDSVTNTHTYTPTPTHTYTYAHLHLHAQ